MEVDAFERVYEAFGDFHAFFAPAFGRKQWREHSGHYLQALLVQSQERRNAENLAEMVPVSARALQRFLTEARWDDDAVIARLQEYLGPRLEHPLAVWVFDGSDFPKQGVKSVGVTRQYCGALGKVANCQAGVFLAHVGPRGRALVDKRLYLPESWTSDPARCATAGVPEAQRRYRAKTGLALEMLRQARARGCRHQTQASSPRMLRQARARGCLSAGWAAGDDAFGMSPGFRDGLTAEGMQYVLDVPPDTPVWPLEPTWSRPAYHGRGRPPQLKPRHQERLSVAEAAWRSPRRRGARSRWRRERRGRGHTGSALSGYGKRGTGSRLGCSGRFTARTWTAASPATTSPTHPRTPPWRPWPAWEGHGGLLRPSSRPRRATWGWMSTRRGHGLGGHHITLCLLAGAFLLSLQQDWGEKMPQITRPQVCRVCGRCCPGSGSGRVSCCDLEDVQRRNERSRRSHEKRRAARRWEGPGVPP